MPDNVGPISGLDKIGKSVETPMAADCEAIAEEKAIAKGTYQELDDGDNYDLRKTFKEEFKKKICWLVTSLSIFGILLLVAFFALIMDYVFMIWNNKIEVTTLLTHIFTHTVAVLVGVGARFFFPQKSK